MAQKNVDATASRKVELAIGELDALSVPPCVAVQYLSKLLQGQFSPASIADIAECEPALAAELIALAQHLDRGPASQRHSIRQILDRLDPSEVRNTLLATKVSASFEIEFANEHPAVPARKDLTLHSLAVACCARKIAEAAPLRVEPDVAYSAGLLHDIGKLALQDLMPRSLAAITKEAEAAKLSLSEVERRHLGTDHALLGKQLARRWRLPESITLAIWLHHSDPVVIREGIPEARTALLVWAADHIVRQAGLGHSGAYDTPESLDNIARVLGIAVQSLQEIRDELPEQVASRSKALGFDLPQPTARYCDLIQASAVQLSRMHTQLAVENHNLQMESGCLNFADEFFRSVGADADAIYLAEDFARRWQRFFQTGSVCVFWPGRSQGNVVELVLVEALGHSRKIVLEAPDDRVLIPKPVASRFAVADARDHIDWLLEQLEVDFDSGRTKLVPLRCDGQTVAVVAFELNYPGDTDFFADKFETAASMAGAILGLALNKQREEHLLERFAQIKTDSRRAGEQWIEASAAENSQSAIPNPQSPLPPSSVEALAEMAAGVAHELNNPLSVIAGRAQLLAQAESDGQKRHVLDVIGENAREASGIVDDLMSFAQPDPPRPTKVGIRQVLHEAVELASQKTGGEPINVQVQVTEGIREAFVDSAQIVSAIANVIANSVESYADALGPVKIAAEPADAGVRVQISDLGYGMNPETIRKATYPFFSAKPAGRKRGMGLAYTARLIQLNRGAMTIESHPEHGTIVTITLPYA
ncbi:MAG: HDOD domain-containing protein [Sedimentisphaerales bacterium]|nr:HDOD domain-containing protein [Sedimentisphaerales bacterium]